MASTKNGAILITTTIGLAEVDGQNFSLDAPTGMLVDNDGKPVAFGSEPTIHKDLYFHHVGLTHITAGPNMVLYVSSENNNLGWIDYNRSRGIGIPPFHFLRGRAKNIHKLWIDPQGDLFIVVADSFYIVKNATTIFEPGSGKPAFATQLDNEKNLVYTKGEKKVLPYSIGKNIEVFSFAADPEDETIFLGTNRGLYKFEKSSGLFFPLFDKRNQQVTITALDVRPTSGEMWFSTLENGMGSYSNFSHSVNYFPYNATVNSPINKFLRIAPNKFLVAPLDSVPAIFNTETASYFFIQDTAFGKGKNSTSAVATGNGNITAVVNNGDLYISKNFLKEQLAIPNPSYAIGPYIKEIMVKGQSYHELMDTWVRYDSLKKIHLKYYENKVDMIIAMRGFSSTDTVVFAWKLENGPGVWTDVPYTMLDERMNIVGFENLEPGTYTIRVRAKKLGSDWQPQEIVLTFVIHPPFWKTAWFWIVTLSSAALLFFALVKWRVRRARKQEQEKNRHEKALLELESKALRAQMNPHFIFNCMNSIKALIQNDEKQRSIDYLTTFSKLIRTLFQNSDKRQISLYDELETCRLYTQLESMRLQDKIKFDFEIDPAIDLKSVAVPALIVQPFIENAIWHGIVPKERGRIAIRVYSGKDSVICEVEDDGIGRELSKINKPVTPVIHESKGVSLSQTRLNLERVLNDTQASIRIIDKMEGAQSTGTKVIIEFNLN
jgi:two-component sensor histidine kinase